MISRYLLVLLAVLATANSFKWPFNWFGSGATTMAPQTKGESALDEHQTGENQDEVQNVLNKHVHLPQTTKSPHTDNKH
ncbi:hypothetical protein Q1695_009140 [Nippostrongylus brasiliensis]|nr:hypothetical protein Q1695_009140 [Nippostrongylus brasiliensis]